MSQVKRYEICGFEGGLIEREGGNLIEAEEFDRVTAERDALQQRLTAADERVDAGIAFVTRLIECAGGQPSIATGYLRDILAALKPAEGGGDDS